MAQIPAQATVEVNGAMRKKTVTLGSYGVTVFYDFTLFRHGPVKPTTVR